MKQITIDYIQHLASFLDAKSIKWTSNTIDGKTDTITIYYYTAEELFKVAFEFGQFYATITE